MFFLLSSITVSLLCSAFCVLAFPVIVCLAIFLVNSLRRSVRRSSDGRKHVVFFHPHCTAGGGGERVLWTAIEALIKNYPQHRVCVYCESGVERSDVAALIHSQFGVSLPTGAVTLVPLRLWRLLTPQLYPLLTLLGQSVGSMAVAVEAVCRLPPDVYIDTTGCAFTMPIVLALAGVSGVRRRTDSVACRLACYVHYPTVSSSMMARVSAGRDGGDSNSWRVSLKLTYYAAFGRLYGYAGRCADVVMTNGRWTAAHIAALWHTGGGGGGQRFRLVFPPCDVRCIEEATSGASDADEGGDVERQRQPIILSVGQFRPEKDHSLQLHSFARFVAEDTTRRHSHVRLVLAGGCRDAADRRRVQQLRLLAEQLQLSQRVQFEVNVSFERLLQLYSRALIGLHTMLDEHFGIGVVEMMAAGLIVVAHDSGGPRADIINTGDDSDDCTGFLADSVEQYSQTFAHILQLSESQLRQIRRRARQSAERFSVAHFNGRFLDACQDIL